MKILLIQTAFLGDVVLATPLIEKLMRFYPGADVDFLLRKGNEGLFQGHPLLRRVLIWDKKQEKYRALFRLIRQIRAERYDLVVNCQRFMAAGFLTVCSGAYQTSGFKKNPLSLFFNRRLPHRIGDGTHEVTRNLALIQFITDASFQPPRLYPSEADFEKVRTVSGGKPYVCLAPTSVWFTKQWPLHKWEELIGRFDPDLGIYLLGAPADRTACEALAAAVPDRRVQNLAGQLTLLQSAALLAGAAMNYVNDSAPLHLASAMNAPVTAIFCSTVPDFGFGPLSDRRFLMESPVPPPCRPCGLHGFKACPKGHFACAETIPAAGFPLPD